MGLVLLVCGATALVAALLAAALLPSGPTTKKGESIGDSEGTGPDLATSRADTRQ